MLNWVTNHVPGMIQHIGQTIDQFGKDNTGIIKYQFNQQGFRSPMDFNFVPEYVFFGNSLVFGIGVAYEYTFPGMFNLSHNYGLAGSYNNDDTFIIIENYLNSDAYSSKTKKAVVWTNRNEENIDVYSKRLSQEGFVQLFCGKKMPYKNCFSAIPNIDFDVSGTHIGIKTHLATYKALCSLFNK
jgi:hypothetical protein